ncbi:MAG TPA: hypothetical protein VGK99_14175 [Acidobacteriota bacterium]|jgi:predicted acyltransferase
MATEVSLPVPELRQAPATGTPEAVPEPKAETAGRLASLDAFRGFTMFWIIGGAAVVRSLAILGKDPVTGFLAYQMEHTPWRGLRYYDLIWPSFMLMVGVSVAFSYASRSRVQSHGRMTGHAFARALILFLLGSLRTSVSSGSAAWIELSSALQPIAVAYFIAFLLAGNSARLQAAAAAVILVGYGLLLHFVPAPGISPGSYQNNLNLVSWADVAVLGRTHPEGWGTVLSTIPTIATTLLGLLIGELLLSSRTLAYKMKIIGLIGVSGIALGLALDPVVPVVMKLWTVSYGIASAGWACLLFLFFLWIIDARGYRGWSLAFVVIGMNAIAAYLAGTLVSFSRIVSPFTNLIAPWLGVSGALVRPLAVLTVEWLVLYWMYRRKIFIRV